MQISLSELHPFKGYGSMPRGQPYQVRDDDPVMKQIAATVRERGVRQPGLVRPDPEGGYEIVSGHRRFRACESSKPGTYTIKASGADAGDNYSINYGTATLRVVERPDVPNIPDTYDIDLIVSEGGEAKTNLTNASAGSTITVTVTPDEGYELDYITVDGERIDGTTFTMPAHDVTVRVYFTDGSVDMPFVDVNSGDWFYEYVEYVYANGLMKGVTDTQFEPNGTLTRAMFWTILARASGVDTEGGESWYAKAQAWAMENGVSDGTDAMGALTREQLATMLWRFAGEPTSAYSLSAYTDASSVSDYAETAMAWAVENGIITGMTDTTIEPQGTATRAQCAAMLMRFIESVA